MKGQEENEIQRYAISVLKQAGILVTRQNQNMKGRPGRRPGNEPGVADLICCVSGRYLAIECKTPDGVQSADQREYERKVRKSKGMYALIRSKTDLHRMLDELHALRLL